MIFFEIVEIAQFWKIMEMYSSQHLKWIKTFQSCPET